MLKATKLTAHAPYQLTYRYGVKNNCIFRICDPNFDETVNVKGKIERKYCPGPKVSNFGGFWGLGVGVRKSFDFYSKRHIYT